MTPPSLSASYLPHINGLRAIAILGVLIYHLSAGYCPAGYFGVDLFLVISGFLLFRSLLKPGTEQNFHYGSYLLKKAWRILPVWFIVTLVVCLASLFLLYPERLTDPLKTARYSAFFLADYYIDRSGDYFNTFSQQNPFLHFWYLSITVQLYIIAPLLVIPVARWCSRRAALILLGLLALLSFIYYILTTSSSSSLEQLRHLLLHATGAKTAYYHLLPRFWEVAAGFGVFLLPELSSKPRLRALLGLLGLAGLLASFYLYKTGSPAVYLTVVCSLLTLRYATTGIAATILNTKPLQALGTISFSLYLWHWPVMVLWKYYCSDNPGTGDNIAMVAVSLLLAILSWWGIERIKTPSRTGRKGTLLRCSLLLTLVILPIFANKAHKHIKKTAQATPTHRVYFSGGVAETDAALLAGLETLPEHNMKLPVLRVGDAQATPSFLFLGDSFAFHLYEGLHEACQLNKLRGLHLGNSTNPFWNLHQPQTAAELCCWNQDIANLLLNYLRNHPDMRCVIISLNWEMRLKGSQANVWPEAIGKDWRTGKIFANEEERLAVTVPGLGEFCDQVRALGKEVVLLGCTPLFPNFPMDEWERSQKLRKPYKESLITLEQHEQNTTLSYTTLRSLAKEKRAHHIDLAPALFREGVCRARLGDEFLFVDNGHLSEVGERLVTNYYMPRLMEILGITATYKPTSSGEASSHPQPETNQ